MPSRCIHVIYIEIRNQYLSAYFLSRGLARNQRDRTTNGNNQRDTAPPPAAFAPGYKTTTGQDNQQDRTASENNQRDNHRTTEGTTSGTTSRQPRNTDVFATYFT